jgi:hypothetical protein
LTWTRLRLLAPSVIDAGPLTSNLERTCRLAAGAKAPVSNLGLVYGTAKAVPLQNPRRMHA